MLALAFAALLCITSIKAQIPDKLKNLPPFKMREGNLPFLQRSHAHGKLNPMTCSHKAPCLEDQKTLGGSNLDLSKKIIQTKDGGFIVCGITYSTDGDFDVPPTNNGDAFLAKYNRSGKLEWTKTFGGTGDDAFVDIAQTYDCGFISTGQTSSNDGDVSGNHGANDVWVVKFDPSGNIEWQKCFGGTGDDFGDAVVQSFYGGYAISGFTNSNDGNISGNHNTDGNFDGWFIQLTPSGNLLLQHCYGGSNFDGLFSMVASDFGSYILEGVTGSNDGDVNGNHGAGDAWVIKVNALGKIIWQKTVGGSGDEGTGSNEMTTTTDGNVVINGYSSSIDGDINAQNDTIVSFVAKLNSKTGRIIWSKSYATPSLRAGNGIFATSDGGTVETGAVGPSFDASTFDVLISKFDKNGNEDWFKRLGGSDFDGAYSGYEASNGDLNILCWTSSTDGDIINNHGSVDAWIIKLGRCEERDELTKSYDNAITESKYNNATLLSAFPNPVSNSTTISFSLHKSQKVFLQIFDMNGKLVKTLADIQMGEGSYQFNWNTNDEKGNTVGSGTYILKMQYGSNVATKKLTVVK